MYDTGAGFGVILLFVFFAAIVIFVIILVEVNYECQSSNHKQATKKIVRTYFFRLYLPVFAGVTIYFSINYPFNIQVPWYVFLFFMLCWSYGITGLGYIALNLHYHQIADEKDLWGKKIEGEITKEEDKR